MVAARLAAGQASLGHDMSMLTHDNPHRAAEIDVALRKVPHFDRVAIIRVGYPSRWERVFGPHDRRTIQQAVAAADSVHIHSVWEAILRVTAAVARRQHKPYFITPHGMLDDWAMKQSPLKKNWHWRWGIGTC